MKNKKLDSTQIWKQLEDIVVPRLRLNIVDRAVYSHLLRHSRLEGKARLRFSILWLARNIRLSGGPVREAVRRLVAQGALRLVERSKAGHVVEVRLPAEIRAVRPNRIERWEATNEEGAGARAAVNIEKADFLQDRTLRKTIHAREGGAMLLLSAPNYTDNTVPGPRGAARAVGAQFLPQPGLELHGMQLAKRGKAAEDFLRRLYRERRLTAAELSGRLRALDDLASGKLRPSLPATAKPAGT